MHGGLVYICRVKLVNKVNGSSGSLGGAGTEQAINYVEKRSEAGWRDWD